MHAKVQLIPSIRSRVMTGTKFVHTYIHTYIYTYIFLKPIILTQEPQKHRNSSKSLIRKFSPLQSFLFEKAIIPTTKVAWGTKIRALASLHTTDQLEHIKSLSSSLPLSLPLLSFPLPLTPSPSNRFSFFIFTLTISLLVTISLKPK